MAMNIVFCADGTWNNPNQDSDGDDVPDPTNVYKLFLCLDGVDSPGALLTANEQEKELANNGVGPYPEIKVLTYPGAPLSPARGRFTLDARDMIVGGVDNWGGDQWMCELF